jgi:hypothetical protein
MRQPLFLGLGSVLVFSTVAAIMIKLMPSPLGDSDYLVIGSVATLVSLLVLFLVLVSTRFKSGDIFYKKRKKQG